MAKPKSEVLVSLFSSPSSYWIKTIIKLFSAGCRGVSSRVVTDHSRGWGGGEENWCGLELRTVFSQLAKRLTPMLVSGIFIKLRTFVHVPDVLRRFSKIGNVFFFRWGVWCQHQLKLYSIERPTGNFGLGKGAEIEGNCFALWHYWSIEEYPRENSESVKQYARIV